MTKVSAGVLVGVLLGLFYGVYNAHGQTSAGAISASLLGRTSQGIINGILAAYASRGSTPLWRGALWGALIGLGLGVIAGLPGNTIRRSILPSALLGLGCGLAAAKAKR